MRMLENWKKSSVSSSLEYFTENESGRFYCDEYGTLTGFEVAEENRLHQPPFGFDHLDSRRHMRKLIIPEGVRAIERSADDLWGLIIVEKLVLPTSLDRLSAGALSHCLIMDMELPVSLREIGPGALMCNYIHTLRIPRGMLKPVLMDGWDQRRMGALTIHGRQFKETIVNTLIVPQGYPCEEMMREAKINHVVFAE